MIDILIITNERPLYLKRAIEYWKNSSFNIIIADGSKNAFKGNLPSFFDYHHIPDTTMLYRTVYLANKVKSKYAAYCADDDFHSFDGLKGICEFLDKNETYSCAQGINLRVGQKEDPQSLLFGTAYKSGIAFDSKKIAGDKKNLLIEMLKVNFLFTYAVMRRSMLKNYTEFFDGIDLKKSITGNVSIQLFEDLMFYALFLSGHYITLPLFYTLRQNQIQNYRSIDSSKLYLNDFFAEWVKRNDKEWQLVKNNIIRLINNKYRFTFNFNEEYVLAKYLNQKIKKNNNKIRNYGYLRLKLNHLKINLFILLKLNFNIRNYISFRRNLKFMIEIIKKNNVEK